MKTTMNLLKCNLFLVVFLFSGIVAVSNTQMGMIFIGEQSNSVGVGLNPVSFPKVASKNKIGIPVGLKNINEVAYANAEQINAWEFATSLEGWENANAGNVSNVDGSLAFSVTGFDPSVPSPVFGTPWIVGNLKYLWIRVKNGTTDTMGAFYIFISSESGGGIAAVTFPLTPNDTEFQDIYVDMTSLAEWIPGLKISQFRLDPISGLNGENGTVYFDFVRIIEDKPTYAISVSDANSKSLTIYQNPVLDQLEIDNAANIRKAVIFDMSGIVRSEITNTSSKLSINTTSLEPGLYVIRATTKQGEIVLKKFIKK